MVHSIFSLSFIILLVNNLSHATIREFETTRLVSSAGAGVGAVLVNETSFLNPASIAFYSTSSIYYQRGTSSMDKTINNETSVKEGNNESLVLADTSSRLKGTFSYQRQYENAYKRTRYTSSLANNFSENQAFGVLYRYTTDKSPQNSSDDFHQFSLGYTYIHNPKLTFGAVIIDPFETRKDDVRFLAGFHYELLHNIFLLVDVGANYAYDAQENTISRTALQLSIFDDFYARVGQAYDKATNLKSAAWGVSWVGPRLSIEYAYKNSEHINKDADNFLQDKQLIEHSLAISVRY